MADPFAILENNRFDVSKAWANYDQGRQSRLQDQVYKRKFAEDDAANARDAAVRSAIARHASPDEVMALDPQVGAQYAAYRSKASDEDVAKHQRLASASIQAATALKSLPKGAARANAWRQMQPDLAALGADGNTLAGMDPNDDTQLDAATARNKMWIKAGEDYTLTPGSRRYDGSNNVVASVEKTQEPFHYTLKDANGVDHEFMWTPGDAAPPAGAVPSGAAGGSSGAPRSVRNNNPGNIEDGSFAKSQPGYKGTDGRFAQFESPEAGAAAQTSLLQSYGQRGLNTVSKVVSRWAPESDGNNVGGYAKFVAQKLGVHPNQTLDMSDPKTLSGLQMAMAQFEGGSQSKSNGPPATSATQGAAMPGSRQLDNTPFATQAEALLTPEESNYYAEQVANGGDLPTLGMGKDAAKVRRQILAQAADININRHIGGTQGNLLKADLKANTRSLTDLTKLRTNVESSERTASLNMDQVLNLAPKGVAGGVPLFNRWIQAGRRAIPGDADLAALDTAMQTAANEYAAVMTRQGGSGTPTSDAARADAHKLLHDAQNLGAISSTIRQMKVDMANRKHALSEQDQILRGNIMAGAGSAIPGASQAPVKISGDEDYARLPSGTRFIGPDGHTRRKP